MDLIKSAYPLSSDEDEENGEDEEKETAAEVEDVNKTSTETRIPACVFTLNTNGVKNVSLDLNGHGVNSEDQLEDDESASPSLTEKSTNVENTELDVEYIQTVVAPFPSNSESFRQIQIKSEPNYDSECESVATANISDSESLDSSDISDHDDEQIKAKKRQPPKAKGELWLQDLPPIEDLHISVPHEECEAIGFIKSIVDTLAVVEAYPLTPALDLDSVLFLSEGDEALGQIFDVFGPVSHPHYCVRFNSKEHIDSRGIKVGALVYCAPKTPHTAYVLVAQLRKLKGTDASWRDDHEIPVDELDFSDDEAEAVARKNGVSAPGEAGAQPRKIRRANPRGGGRGRGRGAFNANNGNPPPRFPPERGQGRYRPTRIAGFSPQRQFYPPPPEYHPAPQWYSQPYGPPPPPPPPFSQGVYRYPNYYPYPTEGPRFNAPPPPPPLRPFLNQNSPFPPIEPPPPGNP